MRPVRWIGLLLVAVFVPSLSFAQASITGVVKDASGAILPGVTVEAASPALIERARTAVTDGGGQYRIIDLRPGTYQVTFTLPGFTTVKREGIELTGAFVATVNAELRVGAVEETVTVTGEAPIVDVQSIRRETVVDGDVVAQIPTSRSYGSLFQLVPNITTGGGTAADVQVMPGLSVFGSPNGRAGEGRLTVDGLAVGAALTGGGVSSYIPDIANTQEVSFSTSGGLGEAESGGPQMNIVPKTGGNSVKGNVYLAGTTHGMVGSNYTDDLAAAGLRVPGDLLKLWDYTVGVGGPILKDRMWYFFNAREEGSWRSVPGMYANVNAGDPTKHTYVPDLSKQAANAHSWMTANLRLTIQPNIRNKINLFWDEQNPCQGAAWPGVDEGCRQQDSKWIIAGAQGVAGSFGAATATSSPEISNYAGPGHAFQRVQQATWTSPMSNRLLLDAGLGTYYSRYGGQEMPGNPTRSIPKMVDQCTVGLGVPGQPCAHGIQNITFGSQDWQSNQQLVLNWRGSASYVTGAHNMKFGYQGTLPMLNQNYFSNDNHLQYRLNNGVPNLLTMDLKPYSLRSRTRNDAFYAQEQWTMKRLTIQSALRYDHAWSYFPEQRIGEVRFLPTAITFPAQRGVQGYHDITPRGGVAYDLFGNGNTAVKVNIGKYLEAATNQTTYFLTNPTARIAGSPALGAPPAVTRAWTDSNGNYIPDCDLLNPLAQNLSASGGDICGQLSNLNFGKPVFSSDFDPAILEGWGVRPSDWQFGASVQQKVLPGVSVEVGYFRRWLQGFTASDNQAVTAADFDAFSITAPSDPRLPNGGGYTVSGLYNVKPAKFGQADTFTTSVDQFGKWSSVYNGVLVNVSARMKQGLTVQGGINSGKTTVNSCEVRAVLPEIAPTDPYCNNDPGFVTRVTGLATYTVPKVDVLLSTTFRSDQGQPLAANYVVTSAVAAQSLGRPLSGVPSVTVNLLAPGEQWGDRINEFDLRVAKVLRFGRTRTNVGVDIYNVLNANPVLTYNQAFTPGGRWLVPTSVLAARFAKISASIDF
jgi:hypothetical protein